MRTTGTAVQFQALASALPGLGSGFAWYSTKSGNVKSVAMATGLGQVLFDISDTFALADFTAFMVGAGLTGRLAEVDSITS